MLAETIIGAATNLIGGILGTSESKRRAQQADLDREYAYYATEKGLQAKQWDYLNADSSTETKIAIGAMVVVAIIALAIILKRK